MNNNELIQLKYNEALENEYENPKEAYELASEGYELAKQANLMKEQADGLYYMSCACRVMSDYSTGLGHALEATHIYRNIDCSEGIVNAQNMIGIIYFYFGDYSTALEHFITARETVTDDVPKRRLVAVINNIGEVYREAGDYELALDSYEQGLIIADNHGLEGRTPYIYNNITDVYMAQDNLEKAMEACQKAFEGIDEDEDAISTAEVEYKLGRLLMLQGDYASAEGHYYTALIKLNRMNNRFYLIELLINMAELATLREQNPLQYLMDALETAQNVNSHSKVSRVYKLLSEYYEQSGDMKSALDYYKHYHMKEKEIEADNLTHRLALMLVEINHANDKNETEEFRSLSHKLERDIAASNAELKKIREENTMLQRKNSIDELTQVYNRRGIDQQFREVLPEEKGWQSALFIIDIDHFKRYNDTWGHIQGDVCLRMVAQALTDLCGKDCFVGRFGGEEFIFYTRVVDLAEAKRIGERIRLSVSDLQMPYEKEGISGNLTVSVGGSLGSMDSEDISRWLDHADAQLYEAKDSGRNQVRVEIFTD